MGVAQAPGLLRGYVRTAGGGVTMLVAPPPGVSAVDAVTYAGGVAVPHTVEGNLVRFTLPTSAGKPADWAVSGT